MVRCRHRIRPGYWTWPATPLPRTGHSPPAVSTAFHSSRERPATSITSSPPPSRSPPASRRPRPATKSRSTRSSSLPMPLESWLDTPVRHFHSPGEALSTVVTDWAWGCPVLARDRTLSAHVPVYAYEFDDQHAPWFTTLPKPNFPTGAFHGGELQYLFEDEQLPGPKTVDQRRLSAQMIRYWSQFAYTGTPNRSGQPRWKPFQADEHVQSLAPNTIGSADLAREHRCAFWASIDN